MSKGLEADGHDRCSDDVVADQLYFEKVLVARTKSDDRRECLLGDLDHGDLLGTGVVAVHAFLDGCRWCEHPVHSPDKPVITHHSDRNGDRRVVRSVVRLGGKGLGLAEEETKDAPC